MTAISNTVRPALHSSFVFALVWSFLPRSPRLAAAPPCLALDFQLEAFLFFFCPYHSIAKEEEEGVQ